LAKVKQAPRGRCFAGSKEWRVRHIGDWYAGRLWRIGIIRSWRSLLAWDKTHSFVLGQLLLASLEFFGHFLMLGTFSKSLEVVIYGAMQLVLDTARARLEVARSTRLYIAAKLTGRLVHELFISCQKMSPTFCCRQSLQARLTPGWCLPLDALEGESCISPSSPLLSTPSSAV
jgi:hypothetical protein